MCLMALAAWESLPIYQIYVVIAYLNGDWDDESYMESELMGESLQTIIDEDGGKSH